MFTNAKKKPVKKAKCKFVSPVCPDRAEAFVGALAEVSPRFSEIPSERDAKTFLLASQGMTQREIAKVLKISQPTVQRTLVKYRDWFGTTLPEDRGEMIGFPRFRVAVEERRVLLRHQLEMAMEEWQQSRQPIAMTRTRTKIYPEGRKAGGKKVEEIQIDEYVQRRNPSASHLNAAAKRSLELTMLEAGYLGVRQLSCDDAIDVDERDRWDREVKNHKATNEGLTRKVAELEAQVAALLAAQNSTRSQAPPGNGPSRGSASTESTMRGEGALVSEDAARRSLEEVRSQAEPGTEVQSTLAESTAESAPLMNQNPSAPEVASPVQPPPSGDMPDAPQQVSQKMNHENQEPCRVHEAERNARVEDEFSKVTPPDGKVNPACISPSFMHPTTTTESPVPSVSRRKPPTYFSVLGPGGRLMWLQKPEN